MKNLRFLLLIFLAGISDAGPMGHGPSKGVMAVSASSGGGGGGSVPAANQLLWYDSFPQASTNLDGSSLDNSPEVWDTSGSTLLKVGLTAGKLTGNSTEDDAWIVVGTTTINRHDYGVKADYFPNGTTATKRFGLLGRWNKFSGDNQYYRLQIKDGSGNWALAVGPDDYEFCTGTLSDWSSGTTTHSIELRMVGSTITAWDEGVQISSACVDTHWPGASGDTAGLSIRNSGIQVDNWGLLGH